MNPNQYPVIASGCSVSLVGRPPVEALVLRPTNAVVEPGNGNGHSPKPAGEDMFLLPSPVAVALLLRCDGTRLASAIRDEAVAAVGDARRPDVVADDVATFLDELSTNGLIDWLDAPLADAFRPEGTGSLESLPPIPSLWLPAVVQRFEVESDISTALVLNATFTGGFGNSNGALPCGNSGGVGNANAIGPCSSGQGNLNIFGNNQCGGGGFLNLFGGPGCGG